MKTVTYEQFLTFDPCWLVSEKGRRKLQKIGSRKTEWTAIDVLNLDEVSKKDRLWTVLREEFIDAKILHEFACRCAERALSWIANPDPWSINAIAVKRKWIAGKTTDRVLSAAEYAVRSAKWSIGEDVTWYVMAAATEAAMQDARRAALNSADAVVNAAWHSAAGTIIWETAQEKERQWQINELKKMLIEERVENDN